MPIKPPCAQIGLWFAALTLCSANSFAQPYPSRAIRLVVPYAAGGGVDVVARILGAKLSDNIKRPVVVDNRPGAGGVIGTEIVARATPDGYTLILGNNSTHGVNQAVNPKLSYDAVRDFTPITTFVSSPMLLLASSSIPVKSVKELIELAKSKPGQLNYGSFGIATTTHLYGELFNSLTGTKIVHVPYSNLGPFPAAIGGEVQLLFSSAGGAVGPLKTGRLNVLATTGAKRSQLLPDVPTMAEQGVNGFETSSGFPLLGPAGLPKSIVTRLNQEVVTIVQSPDFRQTLLNNFLEPVGNTPEQCGEIVKADVARWSRLVKAIGLKTN